MLFLQQSFGFGSCLGLGLSLGFLISFLSSKPVYASENPPQYTSAPGLFDFLPNAFRDLPLFLQNVDPREKWPQYLTVATSSGVLIAYDQEILDASQDFARDINLISAEESGTGSRLVATTKVAGINADLRLPKGLNSTFYYIGDGITPIAIMAGLVGYGALTGDLRSFNTASQMMEAIALTGMFVITLKYSFGRESANYKTRDGGAWRPFPGLGNYLKKPPRYDAMPSGHVATATAALSILLSNYPEKAWLPPVGYSAIGLLMFAMLNNGVHWAGDYPLGIAIGYVAAQTVFEQRKPQGYGQEQGKREEASRVRLSPFVSEGRVGLSLSLQHTLAP